MKKHLMCIVFFLLSAGLCACKGGDFEVPATEEAPSETAAVYEQITPAQAKALMDSEEAYVLLDVRTQAEFAQGHIQGAILIPEYEIAARANEELPNKEILILVYCRSGRRSKIAAQALAELGYTHVKEFGGIMDWTYGTVQ